MTPAIQCDICGELGPAGAEGWDSLEGPSSIAPVGSPITAESRVVMDCCPPCLLEVHRALSAVKQARTGDLLLRFDYAERGDPTDRP